MKYILALLFFPIIHSQAQILDATEQKNCEIKFAKFLPKKNKIIDTALGDYNKDGKIDVVIVTEEKGNANKNRTLIVLENEGNDYKKIVVTQKVILCVSCGGVFGDPYASISFKGNILTINHYGGSAWRWSKTSTFRFQKNEWQLIGIAESSFHSIGCDNCDDVSLCSMNLKEINFSTKKMHTQESKEGTCKIVKDNWKKMATLPIITLNNFDSEKDYFK
jgi:hypothetical protein